MHSVTVLVSLMFVFSFSVTCLLYLNLSRCSCEENRMDSIDTLFSKPDHFLIIIILSSPANKKRRSVLRNTWLQFCKDQNIKYYFVIGTRSAGQATEEEINNENNSFHDILKIENVSDSYIGLTAKILETFVWVNQNLNFKYVLKCDDDSFVHVLELIKLLEIYKEDERQLYLGFFNGHGTVQKSGKWKENNWVLCDFYIPYALGGGYVLEQELVSFLAKNSKDLELFLSEDVSVGAWLASKRHIKRVHSYRFNTEYKSRGCSNSYVVSHKHTDSELQKLYNNLQETGQMCSEEFQIRLSYNYDWTVPPSKCCQRINQIP